MENIKNDLLTRVQTSIESHFQDNFVSLILHGSFARGEADENADLDLFFIFQKLNLNVVKQTNDLLLSLKPDMVIDRVFSRYNDFLLEKHPIHTEIKKNGMVLFGRPDLTIREEHSKKKYQSFFQRSKAWEANKLDIIERTLQTEPNTDFMESIFLSAQNSIRARLAFDGKGFIKDFSSLKQEMEKSYNKHIAAELQLLKDFHHQREMLTAEDRQIAIQTARKIHKIFSIE